MKTPKDEFRFKLMKAGEDATHLQHLAWAASQLLLFSSCTVVTGVEKESHINSIVEVIGSRAKELSDDLDTLERQFYEGLPCR